MTGNDDMHQNKLDLMTGGEGTSHPQAGSITMDISAANLTGADHSRGFVIEELELKEFMRYADTTRITFPAQFIVITGRTGAGKTSLLDAITFALYRRTTRTELPGVKQEDICRKGGYTRVFFTQGGHRYDVKRGITASGQSYVTLRTAGRQFTGSIRETDARIEEIIGLDCTGFLNSTFIRQDEMKHLGSEKGSDRLQVFRKLFRLDTFDRAHEIAHTMLGALKDELNRCEGELKTLNVQVDKIPEIREQLGALVSEIKDSEKSLEAIDREIREVSDALDVLGDRHEEYVRFDERYISLSNQKEEIGKRLKDVKKKGEDAETIKERIGELENLTSDYDKMVEIERTLLDKKKTYDSLMEQHAIYGRQTKSLSETHQRELNKLSNRLTEQERRIKNLSTDIGRYEAFELLRREGTLTERIARIDLELDWLSSNRELVKRLGQERASALAELEKVTLRTGRINADSFIIDEIKDNIEQIRHDMGFIGGEYNGRIEEIRGEVLKVSEALEALDFGEEDAERLNEVKYQLEDKRLKRDELEVLRGRLREIGDTEKLSSELNSRLGELEEEGLRLREELLNLQQAEDEYRTTSGESEELKARHGKVGREISARNGEIKQIRNQLHSLEEIERDTSKLRAEVKQMRGRSEILTLIHGRVFNDKGITMPAVNYLLPMLAREASMNLADMTDNRLNKVRLEVYEDKNRYGVRILVEGADGLFHDVQEFSGGEKTQINAALRFAIARELAGLPQVGRTYGRMETLFIDEGDLGSLDNDASRSLFIKKLFQMGSYFSRVILITHLSDVAEKFPYRISVSMTPDKHSIVDVGGMGHV